MRFFQHIFENASGHPHTNVKEALENRQKTFRMSFPRFPCLSLTKRSATAPPHDCRGVVGGILGSFPTHWHDVSISDNRIWSRVQIDKSKNSVSCFTRFFCAITDEKLTINATIRGYYRQKELKALFFMVTPLYEIRVALRSLSLSSLLSPWTGRPPGHSYKSAIKSFSCLDRVMWRGLDADNRPF